MGHRRRRRERHRRFLAGPRGRLHVWLDARLNQQSTCAAVGRSGQGTGQGPYNSCPYPALTRVGWVGIARYSHDGEVKFGVVEGETESGAVLLADITGHPFGPITFSGERRLLDSVRLLPPVLPSKVVAIGKNYADHATEMGGDVPEQPLVFLKPSTSVVGSGDPIAYPPSSSRVDYEGELAVVIGRLCRDVPESRAAEVVFGYACANDVTARDH